MAEDAIWLWRLLDAWISTGADGELGIATNCGDLKLPVGRVRFDDHVLDAGGLARRLRVFRLPNERLSCEVSTTRTIAIEDVGDTPIWICVTTEDGYQAWTSPVYVFQ